MISPTDLAICRGGEALAEARRASLDVPPRAAPRDDPAG